MDKYQVTVQTFNKLAQQYQDKYMEMELYNNTYDIFCDLISNDRAEILEIVCSLWQRLNLRFN